MATELDQLQDERDIIAVGVRYAIAVDAKDWDSFRSCFTADASGDYSVHVPTYEALEANARRLIPVTVTHHAVTNFQVTVDGDRATSRCHLVAFHYREGTPGGDTFTIRGVYSDRLVRTPDGWRISYRRLDRWHLEGNQKVIPPPLTDEGPHPTPD